MIADFIRASISSYFNLNYDSLGLKVLINAVVLAVLMLFLVLVYLPEYMKVPSYFGFAIGIVSYLVFWGLNLSSGFPNLSNVESYKPGHWTGIFSVVFFAVEYFSGFLALRSTMKRPQDFNKVNYIISYFFYFFQYVVSKFNYNSQIF